MLAPPPRDAAGRTLPHDHPGISPDDGVIRRVSPHHLVLDKDVHRRISTMAFQPSSPERGGGLSVDLQREIEQAGLNARHFVITPPWIGAVHFTAQRLRNEGLQVGFDPLPPENPYHGEVWGEFSASRRKRLLNLARWFVAMPDVQSLNP